MSYKILLVEDDKRILEVVTDFISDKGQGEYEVLAAENGDAGLETFFDNNIDIVLLDVMLPGIDGFSLCREIRRMSTVPILFLTAKGREEDILYGYELGADDYITKPFRIAELFAKIKANICRAKGMVGEKVLICGNIELNPANYTVYIKNENVQEEIILAPKEYALLKYLMENKGKVVSRETLLIKIWGYDFDGTDRVVDNHIKKLRRILSEEGKRIKTVIKRGYKIEG